MNNIITAVFEENRTATITEFKYQYDYGQKLRFDGVTLPVAYEVHFSNFMKNGDALAEFGDSSGVDVPDELFTTGLDIYAFIYLHEGSEDGETVYMVRIPVHKRPVPTDYEPTPAEQTAFEQAVAALNAAVTNVNQALAATVDDVNTMVDAAVANVNQILAATVNDVNARVDAAIAEIEAIQMIYIGSDGRCYVDIED